MHTFRTHSGIIYKYLSHTLVKRYKGLARSIPKMNVFVQKRNPITGNTEWDMENEDYDYHQEIARSAFADMLHDTERNKKYHQAIKLAIQKMHADGKPANVLDIGTGTGLLSIFAARAGADSIVACEAFKPMAECCLKILQQNGVADKITVIPKRSTELIVGEDGDLKQKANILVTEVFDTELIGEGALLTFDHAHKNLLEADCIVVPDSAVIYVQVAECSALRKWNELHDLTDCDGNVILKVPPKIKHCPGAPSVHDIQLSHLQRHQFNELSEQIPILYYDWSGKTPIQRRQTVKQKFTPTGPGRSHVVFMWWELNMDTEGRIVLSCAPWWTHPAADVSCQYPQDTIPWRDHWMQGVYYLPQVRNLSQLCDATLIACQDEYSLWFYLEDETNAFENHPRPVCECGVHMAYSRTHIAYLNDSLRSNMFLKALRNELEEKQSAVILDLNGSSYMGLASAQLGAKKVYILETNHLIISGLEDFIKENAISNVEIVSEITDEILAEITTITCDPDYSSAIMPWENLKMAHILYKVKDKIRPEVKILPESCTFMAMPVELLHLHKIRIPIGNCEGINMAAFDELVESSRLLSDTEFEAHPMWEYSSTSSGTPQALLTIDLHDLKPTYATNANFHIGDPEASVAGVRVNGFVVWAQWALGRGAGGGGPLQGAAGGRRLLWDPSTRQAVRILKRTELRSSTDEWCGQIACDLDKGQFDVNIDLIANDDAINDVER